MDLSSELLFFFSALGSFNGILLGFFFLFYLKPRHESHFFLGLLMLALSVRVGKSVFYYFNYDLAYLYVQIGLFACWFIGPFFFFYVKTALGLSKNWRKELSIHAVFIIPIGVLIFSLFPRYDYSELWESLFLRLIYLQWMVYLCAGFLLAVIHKKKINESKRSFLSFSFWFWSICLGNFLVCLAFNLADYSSYIIGALSFTFIFYLMFLLLLFARKTSHLVLLYPPKYKNKIGADRTQLLHEELEQLMKAEKIFLNPDMKLLELSKRLSINSVKLSQFFNEDLNVSFNDYLNKWRIDYAKKVIKENPNFSFEAVGYDSGFNSKSTFYKAFRKHTGTTPSRYKEGYSNSYS